jgi:hypothetical protein
MDGEYVPEPLPRLDPDRCRRPGESLHAYIERVWPAASVAIADVDRTLFSTTLPLSPIERLEQATQTAWELEDLRTSIQDARKR